MVTSVKTTIRGQISLPADIRRKYRIRRGTVVVVEDENGVITIRPTLAETLKRARQTLAR